MATRLGVDIGGTFTDLVFYDEATGDIRIGKEPTAPTAPEEGVLAAIGASLPEGRLAAACYFLHGTTVGINSLVTRTGAVVGLLATRGFRDFLELARGDRSDPYDLFWRQTAPLVPRHLRLPVKERISAKGEVLTPLDEDDVRAALETFREENVDSIAVAFLNAYANPAHEKAAFDALRKFGFEGEISLSHAVSGEYHEYERTSTAVIDAYVRPRMVRYLAALEGGLRAAGFEGTGLVTRSGGGALTFAEAAERPFETIMSGPVAGAEGAGSLARKLGLETVITADVGGTTFDTCLIASGQPQLMYQGEVEGMPVQAPWMDVRSIGAGGGSIAYVDVGGLLRVGPDSAGAVPGPACYGRSGSLATVTDAAFLLGMLGDGRLASGLVLDREKAIAAVEPLAKRLGYTVDQTAQGIMTLAASSMAGAIRAITIERGHDPREAALMPFGGAGPMFGTLLARELDIRHIVVPPFAGNFSAWGLLSADHVRSVARTRIMLLDEAGVRQASAVLRELFQGLPQGGAPASDIDAEAALDLRFLNQEHTLTVTFPGGGVSESVDEIRERFLAAYEATFGHVIHEAVEIVTVRASVRTRLPRITSVGTAHGSTASPSETSRDAWSFTRAQVLPFRIVARDELGEASLEGPAIIVEHTATTYVDAEFVAHADSDAVVHIVDTKGG